jgi:hypothetical protein
MVVSMARPLNKAERQPGVTVRAVVVM